jgi:hypothetical protein
MVMGEWPACRLGRSAFDSPDESLDLQDSLTERILVVATDREHQLLPTIAAERRSLQPC